MEEGRHKGEGKSETETIKIVGVVHPVGAG